MVQNRRAHIDLAREFESLGLDEFAYVRAGLVADHEGFVIRAANGRELGFAHDRKAAIAAAARFDLRPVEVH